MSDVLPVYQQTEYPSRLVISTRHPRKYFLDYHFHGRIQAQRLRDQLRVALRRQSDAPFQNLLAKTLAVDQLSIVRYGHRSLDGVQDERLAIDRLDSASCRVTGVADAETALQLLDGLVGEHVADHSDAFVRVKRMRMGSLAGHYAGHLLATMLQRDQAEAYDLGDVNLS